MEELKEQFIDFIIDKYTLVAVFLFLLFFLWKQYLKRFKKNEKKRNIIAVVIAIMSTPIILFFIFFFLILFSLPSLNFSKDRWIKYEDNRIILINDLLTSKILIGKTKTEVIDLLGDQYEGSENNWSYYLGTPPSKGDDSYLKIYFEKEQVIKVEKEEF